MKQFYPIKKLFFTIILLTYSLTNFAQNAIAGAGFTNGWPSACNQNTNFVYFNTGAGTSYTSGALTPRGTGNQFWRMGVDWSGTIKQMNNGSSSDLAVTPGTKYTLNSACTGNGAFFRNISSTSNRYVFKTLNAGTNPTGDWVFFELSGAPITISSVSQSPTTSNVTGGQTTTVTANLSGALPTGQSVYLRYTSNNYGSSTVVQLSGSGTSYTATIPGSFNTTGANVSYYLFTSGSGLTISGSDADLYTINLNNNGGSNYTYTVLPPPPTITLGGNPTVCRGVTSASLSYSATTNSPNQYSIVYDTAAISAGFSNIINATLPATPITITVPGNATPAIYNANLTVRNTTTNAVSVTYPITITVTALPTAGIVNNTGATNVTCAIPSISLTATGGTSYSWSNGASVVSSIANLSVTSAGTYTLTVTTNGCSSTANIVITQNTAATSSSQTVTACDTYFWSVNGTTYTTSGTYTFVGTNAAGCVDTKTLNLTINSSSSSSQTVTACDTYTWSVNGQTYTTSGTYTFVGTNAAGCPDTKTLLLTINNSTSSSQTASACDTYTWSVNGQTYTSSGTYTSTSTNAAGCPDTKTLVLTIYASTPSSQTVTACDTYTWSVNGQTYTTSGTYVFEGTNAAGCSQNVTLNLTINSSTSSSESVTACDTYTWSLNGQTYISSGTYTFVGTNVAGCPDTKTLVLTINNSSSSSQTVSACETYTWTVNEQTYTTSGTYTSTSTNSAGCTDTKTLVLTINTPTSSSQTVSACDTYTWSVNGQTYTESGTYTFVGTNAAGCTDTKTLNLTINSSTSSSQTVTACQSYTWSVNGTTYISSGTYTFVGTNAAGCTDIKTLVLTIEQLNRSNATSTWTNGQNDSTTGFGAWALTASGGTSGFFSGSSDVNNGGTRSWGMYASGGDNVASAIRPVTLGVGNTLSFSMDNGFIDTGKTIGFGLQNSAGENLAELIFIGGQSAYRMIDANSENTTIGYTGSGLDISLTYTGLNTYSITVSARGGSTATYTGRTFTSRTGGQRPTQIRFFNAGAGTGSNFDLFFNSLAINNPVVTTQPSAVAQNVCVGTSTTNLEVAASGSDLTYQWYSSTSNTTYAGATSLGTEGQTATLLPQNSSAGTLYYYCIVTGSCGSTYSNFSGAVTVTSPLNAGTLSGTEEICVNGLATFSTNGTTGGSWSSSAPLIASVNTAGVVSGVSAGSATITYSLNGTGGCSNATATRSVTVNPLPTTGITNNTGSTVITCSITSISVTATGGDSYSWSNGTSVVSTSADLTITAGGTYTVTATNSFGCTSTASITITENKTTTSSQTVSACDTYTWSLNGQTYTISGNYTFISTNEAGCVNTATLNLTITPSTTNGNLTATACDTYTWSAGNGATYTESGTYTYTYVTGCNTATLNLTIIPSSTNTTEITACESYIWPVTGLTYTDSDEITETVGCVTETLVLTINNSTSSSQTASACDTYTWSVNGQTYTSSGTYTSTSTNAAGCPDTKTLVLTIYASTPSSQTVTACDTYTWSVNGQTYTTSGTYVFEGTNAAGCSQNVTLNLTINSSTASSHSVSACDTYTWSLNGQTYTESGTYTFVGTNAAGCPDTKTLVLTINNSTSSSQTVSACETYTWTVNEQTYTTSGTYTSTSINTAGCPDTKTLILTINTPTSSSQTVSECDTYTWSVNGQTYTESGTYTFVGTNAAGCTDTKTLNLTINSSTSSSQTVTACQGYTWSVNGTTYTSSGTYTFVGTNAAGCTDTKTLVLTIEQLNRSNATSTWTNDQNDSTKGFGAWALTASGGTSGFFSGSSDVNNGGTRSWGMYASGGDNVASAIRPVTLGVGNTLSFSMDNGFIDTGKTIGFGLQNSAGENLAELIFIGGQSTYRMIDANSENTTIGYTGSGLDISLTYTGLNTYSITVSARGGSTATYTGRTFTSRTGGQRPAQIRFFNAGAGTGSNFDFFFNSLAINNPVVTTQPSAAVQNVCVGTPTTNLEVAASGSDLTYQWYSSTSNTTYAGATNLGTAGQTTTLLPQNSSAGTLYYYCIVTGSCGSTYSNFSGAVTVTSPLNAGTLSGTEEICVNGLATFSTNGTTGGSWSSSAPLIASVNTAGVVSGVSAGSATITYSLNGTGGCSNATATRSVTVNPLPTAGITNNTGSTEINCSITSISVTATGADSYSWSNGTSVVSTSADLTIIAGGTYAVTVTNSFGCTSTTSITITENKTTTSSQTVSACDTYTWSLNGQTYNISGNYTFISTNESGCVNTATLNLTITPSTTNGNLTTTACDTYTWSAGNGATYTESGTYTYVTGCNTASLNLTITPSTINTTEITACESYIWPVTGITYTDSDEITETVGCVTETLVLTINNSTSSSQTASACDTYTWSVNGQTYTSSGTYSSTSTNAAGCPDTKTLVLTINNSTSSSESAIACDSYTWSENGQTYTSSGTYTSTSTNAAGCSDTKTLVLTINSSTSESTSVTACDSYTWTAGTGTTYNTSGTYTSTSTNAAGCPDTKTLVLTINPCESVVTVKMNIQGYYDADAHAMRAVMANQGVSGATATDVDDVTVELRNSTTNALVVSTTARLKTDGTATATFVTAPSGSFYIAVKHRNTIQTWSATAQTVGATPLTYDFTTAANKAYGDNMIQLESGVYGFYSGDLNQDEAVDIFDFPLLLNDNDNFSSGYLSTDLNGDGAVDIFDFPLLLNNNDNFIYSSHP